jgi:tripartite motif-containing protein 71
MVDKFSSTGAYLSQFGGCGSGNGQFSFPIGIALDSDGNSYVTDFSQNGERAILLPRQYRFRQ